MDDKDKERLGEIIFELLEEKIPILLEKLDFSISKSDEHDYFYIKKIIRDVISKDLTEIYKILEIS